MAATASKKKRGQRALHVRVRELQRTGGSYWCTILCEGPGNAKDRNWYSKEALRDAVSSGAFNGLRAYLNHATPTEEREMPERDVRRLAGVFSEARFVDGARASVQAKFTPAGMDPDGVTSLIESSLAAGGDRPLIGISIDGAGEVDGTKEHDGRTYAVVRRIATLGSADLVTSAGVQGAGFHRRLSESAREALRSGSTRSKPIGARKLARRLQEAARQLTEALAVEDLDAAANTLQGLRRLASRPLKESARADPSREKDSPAKPPGSGVSSISPGPGRRPRNDPLRAERKKRVRARSAWRS